MDVGIEVDDAIYVAAHVIISALCELPFFQDMVVDAQVGSDFNLFDFGFPIIRRWCSAALMQSRRSLLALPDDHRSAGIRPELGVSRRSSPWQP